MAKNAATPAEHAASPNYGALRPPGLPVALTPRPRNRARADHSAAIAISRVVYRRLGRWAFGGAALHPAA
ncbi:DUF6255 family natural product biosynthesis protein [Streptomyces sp. NPDC037389]|uniref:DUF6255 family natural product biosynthesis protein n=1 Tax=Streptomyces sp. NPDC037389 TaxID=3155369 RepID=UPI0033EF41B2